MKLLKVVKGEVYLCYSSQCFIGYTIELIFDVSDTHWRSQFNRLTETIGSHFMSFYIQLICRSLH